MEEALKENSQPLLELKPVKHKKHLSRRSSEIIFIIFMLLLPTIQFFIFWVVPNFDSIVMGFQSETGQFSTSQFERFFEELKTGKDDVLGKYPEIIYAIKNSLIYFAVNIFICTPLVIFFSYVLFRRVPLNGVFKVVFYLPSIIGATVTTTLYRLLLLDGGPLFELLKSMGWISKTVAKYGLFESDSTAFLMVLIYSIWTCVGINMIMFHGAMKRIPQEIFESADIDGVGFFRQFFDIVIPLIWPTITTLIIFSLSGLFISYGSVMILAPEKKEASMIGWFIMHWTTATDSQHTLRYPAAIGLVFTIIGTPFILVIRWLLNKIGENVEY